MSNSKITKRNVEKSKETSEKLKQQIDKTDDSSKDKKNPKYGPMPRFPGQRVWSRGIMILGILLYVWYTSKDGKETSLAKQNEIFLVRGQSIDCDRDYLDELKGQFPGCAPKKCGRYISDKIVTPMEAETLLKVAAKGMELGGSDGGASILDLHSGALSYKDKFINIYTVGVQKKFITAVDLAVYKSVRTKIQLAIAEKFGINVDSLYLTHPTFFSRLTNLAPKTAHDEYWHIHVDKVTYESFHYTSLLYLNDYGIDFKGGRFVFVDNPSKPYKNTTVEPRKARVSMFTSGAENPHFVEPVTEGTRFAITVSFTCDKSKSIEDPEVK